MTDRHHVIAAYFDAWNETEDDKRRELIKRAWADECRYVDPLADATGHEAIDRNVAAVQEQFPGHRFRRSSGVDAHHDRARFAWELLDAIDGTVVVGVDYAEFAEDGRLRVIAGFFGPVPEEAG